MGVKSKDFLLDIFFPRFCLGCQKEGIYLCDDCQATLEISQCQRCLCDQPQIIESASKCPKCRGRELKGVFTAVPYQNNIVKNLIQKFKYEPFVKELAQPLSLLITNHWQLLNYPPDFSEFVLIPAPLGRKKLKRRGFNQAEEIAKELAVFLKIPLLTDVLIKTKETLPQVSLTTEKRKENIKGAFLCQNQEKIQGRRILLADDVYTTGATMEECALTLKRAGAKEVWGVTVARG